MSPRSRTSLAARRAFPGLALALVFGGCNFDSALVGDAGVPCSREDPVCPAGFVCQVVLGRCLSPGEADQDPPGIAFARVPSAPRPRGAVVRVEFSATEALAREPRAQLNEPGQTLDLALVDFDGGVYGFERTVGASDVEGTSAATVDLVDTSGNEARGLLLGVVALDFTPPVILEAEFVAPHPQGDAGVVEVRGSDGVAVRVLLSEPVRPGVRLLARSEACDAGLTFPLAAFQGDLVDFSAAAPAGLDGCAYALSFEGATDLAGNVGVIGAQPLGLSYRVDAQTPRVSALGTFDALDAGWGPASAFSRAPGHDAFGLRFTLEGAASELTVRVDDALERACSLDACAAPVAGQRACACARPVGLGDAEGGHVVSVTVRDAAGNSDSASVSVRFDFSAPALVPGSAQVLYTAPPGSLAPTPTALGPLGSARVVFTLDEPGTQVLSVAPAGLVFALDFATPTSFAVTTRLVSGVSVAEGPQVLTVTTTDALGNTGPQVLPQALLVDTGTPAAPDVTTAGATVYTRVPWGDAFGARRFDVFGAPGAVEPGATVVVFDALGAEVGRGPATATGAFGVHLSAADRTSVSLVAVDAAGNQSPLVPVREVEWVASLKGKVVGSIAENPHEAVARGRLSRALEYVDDKPIALPAVLQGRADWREAGVPSPRANVAMTWDEAHGRVLVFGGSVDGGSTDELWEWDGTSWRRRADALRNPDSRTGAAMAFDLLRGQALVFGGLRGTGFTDAAWEWDGTSWQTPSPGAAAPVARGSPAMAYDARRRRAVVFGGETSSQVVAGLSEWDGQGWRLLAPAGGPQARRGHAMAYDTVRGVTLVFGGETSLTGTSPTDELWSWDGTAWQALAPTGPRPAPRTQAAGAWDEARGVFVVFGGRTQTGLSAELWEWSGSGWTTRSFGAGPSARAGHGLAYDKGRGRVVLFGGVTATGLSADLWEWDGTAWTQRTLSTVLPSPRTYRAAAYDAARKKVVVFGGEDETSYTRAVWEWDGATWVDRTSALPAPTFRTYAAMTYDTRRKRIVLYGGYNSSGHLRDIWEWDGIAWVNRTPAVGGPVARDFHGMDFDEALGVSVVFAGGTGGGDTNELWQWDGTVWTNRAVAGAWPTARHIGCLAYDIDRARHLYYGGAIGGRVTDEFWEWSGSSWTGPMLGANGGPGKRAGQGLAYDATQKKMVMFGGGSGQQKDTSLWLWDGATWEDASTAGGAPSAAGHSFVYDSGRRRIVYVGGSDLTTGVTTTWEWGLAAEERPAALFRFDFAQAGEPSATLVSVTATAVVGGDGWAANGAAAPGAALWTYDERQSLVRRTSQTSAFASPGPLEWSTSDPVELGRLRVRSGQVLAFGLTPAEGNGPSDLSRLRVTDAVLRVRYRRP